MTIYDSVNDMSVTIDVPGELSDDDYNLLMSEISSIVDMLVDSCNEENSTLEDVSFTLNETGTKLSTHYTAVDKNTGKTEYGEVTIDVQITISKD